MNVLILTGRFGMGHYSVSKAIKEKINADNIYIIDIIDYMFPKINNKIYKTFYFMVKRCSKVYNYLNNMVEKTPFIPFKSNSLKKIDKLVKKYNADIVVSTLPISSHYISKYKEKTGSKIKLYTYITDITIHEEWIAPYTNLYFVGDISTKNFLISKHVNKNNIIVSGIPVRKLFDKQSILKKKEKKEILIMGGGLGVMPFVYRFIDNLHNNSKINITIITGNNKKLKTKLEKKYPNINVLGYVSNINEYMNNTDLIVTKSGGITTFEAIYSLTPLLIIKPFLMQEVGNAKFILNNNLGMVEWDNDKNELFDIIEFLFNEKLQKEIKNNMLKIKKQMESIVMNSYYK